MAQRRRSTLSTARGALPSDADQCFCRLYSLIAEEQADEDALYALSKTLERGQIEVQAYLKAVRSLARDQFMKKALINKIVAYAHIPK